MTKVQFALRQLACAAEQDVPYEDELKLSAQMDDELREMAWLFDDLRAIEQDLISLPDTPEDKLLLKKFKLDRKALEKKLQAEHTEKFKAERAASKAAMKEQDKDVDMKE